MTSPYQKDAYTLNEIANELNVEFSQLEYWIAEQSIAVCVRIFDGSLKIYRVEGVSRSNSYSTATPNQLFRIRYPVSNIIYQPELDHVVSTVHVEPDAHRPLKPLLTELDLHPYLYINKKDLLISHFEKERFKTEFLQKINPNVLPNTVSNNIEPSVKKTVPRPRTKQRDQENEIISWLEKNGYDPLNLPKDQQGKSGIKAIVKIAMSENHPTLFDGLTVFNKAWDRLSGNEEIKKTK